MTSGEKIQQINKQHARFTWESGEKNDLKVISYAYRKSILDVSKVKYFVSSQKPNILCELSSRQSNLTCTLDIKEKVDYKFNIYFQNNSKLLKGTIYC